LPVGWDVRAALAEIRGVRDFRRHSHFWLQAGFAIVLPMVSGKIQENSGVCKNEKRFRCVSCL
jgi:hypothetical protein